MAEPGWAPPFLLECHYLQTKVICTATASKRPSVGLGRARGESLRASSYDQPAATRFRLTMDLVALQQA
jgi:hypothetical protein